MQHPHDLSTIHFPDHHVADEPDEAVSEEELRNALWRVDNVELTTVGIDVGSSTSHLMFSRIHLQRLTQRLSSRFVVVRREVLWKSPIWLTPYRSDNRIDAEQLGEYIDQAYRQAGLTPSDVDTGAVILTGEALKRTNSRAIADLFADQAGKFVCASAGHNLEAIMAAHGSGAVARSRQTGGVVLNVDIGGGTSKLALVRDGEVLATAATSVGGRLIATDEAGRIERLEGPASEAAQELGLTLRLGQPLTEESKLELCRLLIDVLLNLVRREPPDSLGRRLLLTEPIHNGVPVPDEIAFSGGVSEYLYGREQRDFGDLAPVLAQEVKRQIDAGAFPAPVVEAGERIRATVIGASQFSVQLSGNTIAISDNSLLPVHNLQVLFPHLDTRQPPSAGEVAQAIQGSLARLDVEEGSAPLALAFSWDGDPFYPWLRALADGIVQGLPRTIERALPLVIVFDRDLGQLVGSILKLELKVPGPVISIDGMELREFDYIDIGEVIQPTNVVPVVIKSLLFPR